MSFRGNPLATEIFKSAEIKMCAQRLNYQQGFTDESFFWQHLAIIQYCVSLFLHYVTIQGAEQIKLFPLILMP